MTIKERFRRIQRAFAALAVEPEEPTPIRVEEPAPARKPKPQNAGRHWRRVSLENLTEEQKRLVEQVHRMKRDRARAEMRAYIGTDGDGLQGWGMPRDALIKTLRARFGDDLVDGWLHELLSNRIGFEAVAEGRFRLGRFSI